MHTTLCNPLAKGSDPLYILPGKFPAAQCQKLVVDKSYNVNKGLQTRMVPATLVASALTAAVSCPSLQEGKTRSNCNSCKEQL